MYIKDVNEYERQLYSAYMMKVIPETRRAT